METPDNIEKALGYLVRVQRSIEWISGGYEVGGTGYVLCMEIIGKVRTLEALMKGCMAEGEIAKRAVSKEEAKRHIDNINRILSSSRLGRKNNYRGSK